MRNLKQITTTNIDRVVTETSPVGTTRCRWMESLRIAKLTGARPNLCWWNCCVVLDQLQELGYGNGDGVVVVEGTLTVDTGHELVSVEHYWIEKSGWVIDPTIALMREPHEVYYYRARLKTPV